MLAIAVMLFIPGQDERKLAKVRSIAVDAFILDLEDSVAEDAKPLARERVRETLTAYRGHAQLHVRVNAFDTGLLYDDLTSIALPGLRGIVLPKAANGAEIHTIDWLLGALERRNGVEPGTVEILPLIESVRGLENVDAIATASKRIRRLGFGNEDFSLDAGLPTPAGVEPSPTLIGAKSALVLASRKNGLKPPHDGAYVRFRDSEGLIREAKLARQLGFFGKHAIHPGQISPIQDVFRPSPESVENARAALEQFEAGLAAGVAAVSVDGQMVDYAVAERARRVLEAARRQGDAEPGAGASV